MNGVNRMARIIQVPNGGFESGDFFPWRDVGRATIGTAPNTGQYNAFLLARPFESTSITTRLNLSPPEPRGFYSFLFWATRASFTVTGTLVVTFATSILPPLIIPAGNIPLVTEGYRPFTLRVPASALQSRNTDVRIELNGGGGGTSTSVLIDDAVVVAT